LKIYRSLSLALLLCIFLTGCSGIEVPTVGQILKDPLGEGSLKIGMAKSQVVSIYGSPSIKTSVISDEWKQKREEWVYKAKYSVLPVSAGYLSEDLYLYFDGDILTNISRKPLGKRQKENSEDIK